MTNPLTDTFPPGTMAPKGGFFDFKTPKPFLLGAALASLLGALFSAVSTADFITHLDRQFHSIHCSLIPGLGLEAGESGCRTVMMSPYSSLLRETLWGGLPISLLALAVFAYLAYRSLDFALRAQVSRQDTIFLVAGTLLPVGMSVIYGYIAAAEIEAVCKLCVGVYVSSGLAFIAAAVAHHTAPLTSSRSTIGMTSAMTSPNLSYARWFGEGVLFVVVLAGFYVMMAPVSEKALAGCGSLVKREDPNGIMLSYAGRSGATPAIAVLDPLCPACRAFDHRLEAAGLTDRLDLKTVLFPLDNKCNWMLKESLHPGACAVSEAMLCDSARAPDVLRWAFEQQESLLAMARAQGEGEVRKRILERFPELRSCLGSPKIQNKLNKSLRWGVANAIPVLTPQLFIGDRRVCDEDTDLGLEYTVAQMLERGPDRR